MNLKSEVRAFITRNFYVPDGTTIADNASLLDQGVIDSTGVLEVISFLEDVFQLTVEDTEMVPENLDSIDRITAFVERKRATAS
jgi:acyl carrier protein